MNPGTLIVLLTVVGLSACSQETGPPVSISNIRVLAPLTPDGAAIAYFVVHNKSNVPIVVDRISSPQFFRTEVHETKIVNGISTMRHLDSVTIERHSTAAFETGGKHIMLEGATADVSPGTLISLEFHFDDSLLIVSTTMQSRLPAN